MFTIVEKRKRQIEARREYLLALLAESSPIKSVDLVHRRCPVCGVDEPIEEFSTSIYTFSRCPSCSLLYTDKTYPEESDIEVYTIGEKHRTFWEEKIRQFKLRVESGKRANAYSQALDRIKKNNPTARTLLDVGCSVGEFLFEAAPHFSSVEGLELNINTSVIAQDLLKVKIHRDPLEKLDKNLLFDVIAFNQVIEHLTDPLSVILSARDHLTPNGIIYINCPNGNAWALKVFRGKCIHVIDRFHLNLFTAKSLAELAKYAGLHVLEQENEPHLDIIPIDLLYYWFNASNFLHRANYNGVLFPLSMALNFFLRAALEKTSIVKQLDGGSYLYAIFQNANAS